MKRLSKWFKGMLENVFRGSRDVVGKRSYNKPSRRRDDHDSDCWSDD